MKRVVTITLLLFLIAAFITGCSTTHYSYREDLYTQKAEVGSVLNQFSLEPALEEKILALDPEQISERDIREILSFAPAPRIVNIHGGIYPVHRAMESFSKFLIGMGYPENKIRNPKNGDYSYSCYENSEKLAGFIAWYYEKEGMRPMIVGHSQGGMQAVKVLHELSGSFSKSIPVWNPLTEKEEERYSIVDPLTGEEKPVVKLQVSYATAVGAGGFTRFLPNQWSMLARLRKIPDSVEEFTGFYMGMDLFGGDLLGFGSLNKYEPNGKASVRNVQLPVGYNHVIIPVTRHLAKSQEIKDWVNSYTPSEQPALNVEFESSSANILWAADVWHSIKKHWVLELQRLIRARRNMMHGTQ
jgi:hypothetical protein